MDMLFSHPTASLPFGNTENRDVDSAQIGPHRDKSGLSAATEPYLGRCKLMSDEIRTSCPR
jgi:hypothetical protein